MRVDQNRNSGFTLVETLITVAILMILLSVSAVGVARSRDHLKITELDNAAWEIYMAAQNRAVLLQNSGRLAPSAALLKSIDPEPSGPIVLSNASASGALDELLPVGSIDPALREGHFCILYDEKTGHVIEVFYAEGEIGADLDSFRKSPSDRVSDFRAGTTTQLVGYYGDTEPGPGDIGTKLLPAPGVEVLIDNGEELKLNVKCTLPDGLPDGVDRTLTVRLEYAGKKLELSTMTNDPRRSEDGSFEGGRSVTYTWVLDSLKKDAHGSSMQFKALSGNFADLGGDFTVTAGLKLSAEGYISSACYATGTDNSLFAKDSTYDNANGTAKIKNLRHLQNLCSDFSGVGEGIVKAEQLDNIDFEAEDDHKFIPIVNENLSSYDGQEREVRGLIVEAVGNAGLFGEAACADMSISRVRLVAPEVTSTGGNAGGLVGKISQKCKISDCRVYWEEPSELVASSGYSYKIKAKAAGKSAGGLIGATNASVTIEKSFAAATVSGGAGSGANNGASGGLIGRVSSGPATITHSYADCYLKASGTDAGGLVGTSNGSSQIRLKDCYAAGFIIESETGGKTGGLVGDSKATTTADGVYSVVRVVKDGKLKRPQELLAHGLHNKGDTRYLFTKAEAEEAFLSAPFSASPFKRVTEEDTCVYNLRRKVSTDADRCVPPYPFPGLMGLPHYGDWAELKVSVDLAYYEQYEDGTYAAEIGGGSLEDGLTVSKDGYALAVKTEDRENLTNAQIVYGNNTEQTWTLTPPGTEDAVDTKWTWTQSGTTSPVEPIEVDITEGGTGGTGVNYTLIPLPDEVVAGDLPTPDFYQKLTVRVNTKEDGAAGTGGSNEDSKDYYFNPHFAKTVKGSSKPAEPTNNETSAISVRTPRHLYDLTRSDYYSKEFYFKQELDLDYDIYKFPTGTGPALEEPEEGTPYYQQPLIGTDTIPFQGTYDGDNHFISDVAAAETESETPSVSEICPLFGAVEGSLIDIKYDPPASSTDAGP